MVLANADASVLKAALVVEDGEVTLVGRRAEVAAGTELRPFPRSVLEPCFVEAYKFYDELAAKDPKFKKIYEQPADTRSYRDNSSRVRDPVLERPVIRALRVRHPMSTRIS